MFRSASLTVGGTAVSLASNYATASNTWRSNVRVHNMGPYVVYVGDSQVRVGTGMAIASNAYETIPVAQGAEPYAIAGGSSEVRILEIG